MTPFLRLASTDPAIVTLPVASSERESDRMVCPRVLVARYRLEHEIAAGGMGVVYRGTQLGIERPVAVKVMSRALMGSTEALERFNAEARLTARLKGAHVPAVLDMGYLDDGRPFIVYEYLDGSDLREILLERGVIALREAVDWTVQMCEALAEAHANGIIHRDIKPENLFITRSPEGAELVKVLDFGVSKCGADSHRSITDPGNALGSPQYMAPEQMLDPSAVDARADIWAVGAVLYEMLTGCNPFERGSIAAICTAVRECRPQPICEIRPDVPRAVEAVAMRALMKDPSARFSDVGQIALALSPFGLASTAATAQRTQRILGRVSRSSRVRPALEMLLTPSGAPMTYTARMSVITHRRVWVLGAVGLSAFASVAAMPWAASGARAAQLWATEQFVETTEPAPPAVEPVVRDTDVRAPEARFAGATAVPERDAPESDPATSWNPGRDSIGNGRSRAVPVAPIDARSPVDHLEVARP